MADPRVLLEPIIALHERIRASVLEATTRSAVEDLSGVAGSEGGDTIYAIDRVSESILVEGLAEIATREPMVLIAEGIPDGVTTLPAGTPESDCRWRVIVDPIDGTRGIMYQKRSAWILTGVAPNRGADTRLRDIVLAVQTEIPLVKQYLCDQMWALRGEGVQARRFDVLRGEYAPLRLRPSGLDTLEHGFATISRFFPGVRDVLAAIDDEVIREHLGPTEPGRAACFEDQYASTGGQFYELMAGHDRFIADLRPLMEPVFAERGLVAGLYCHPYDVCTSLIAEELGVVLTDGRGGPIDAPLTVDDGVSWAGYANERLHARVEPLLNEALNRRGLL